MSTEKKKKEIFLDVNFQETSMTLIFFKTDNYFEAVIFFSFEGCMLLKDFFYVPHALMYSAPVKYFL